MRGRCEFHSAPAQAGLQPDKAADKTDTQTSEGDDDEHLNQRIARDSPNVGLNPADGGGHDGPHVTDDSSHSSGSSGSLQNPLLSSVF